MIFLPKTIVPLQPTWDNPLFFFAGPIRGGGDWQTDMAELVVTNVPTANIACPSRWKRGHRLEQHFHQPFSDAPNRQLVWERYYLKQAGLEPEVPGCVMFWLGLESETEPHPGPEPYAMDTRREIGKFTAYLEVMRDFPELGDRLDVRVAVGGHPDFYGLSVIMDELQNAAGREVRFCTSKVDLLIEALCVARQSH